MQLLQDGLVAMLAAIGLASIMWMVVKAVLYAPLERRLEGQIRIMERLRKEQALVGTVLLVDCGLTEEGLRLARLLARDRRWVAVCAREEIGGYLQ